MMKLFLFLIMLNFMFFLNFYLNIFFSVMLMLLIMMIFLTLNFNIYWMNLFMNLGFDSLSLYLFMLTLLIFMLMILMSFNKEKMFYMVLYLLMMILLLSFVMMNLFMYYLMFEISLIPTLVLILGWGYQYERINAGMYMLIYTIIFSLPFMIFMIKIFENLNSLNFLSMNFLLILMMKDSIVIMMLLMLLGFMVKLPMFMIHIWLPKAHVQAPVVGSMVLAAIMLKLGGYGILRILEFLIFEEILDMIMLYCILGMIFLSLLCLSNYDMKMIVAYSSVIHMGFMLVGLFTESKWGVFGGFMMMLGHGLCSSSLFFMVNLLYERSMSRNLIINKGMIYFLPSMMLFWFLLCMNNLGSPISLNLLSEIMIVNILFDWTKLIMFIIIFSMFFGACYNLYLFSYIFHGLYNSMLMKIYSLKVLDYYILLMHFIPLNFLIMKLNLIL